MEKHISVPEDNIKAIDLLAEHTDLSRQQLKKVMQQGAVWLTHKQSTRRLRRATKKLQYKQSLHIYYDPNVLNQRSRSALLIADEGDYSVWFKPCGMYSQGSKYGDHSTLYRWAETHLTPQRNAFPVHRLDRATSGLIIIAHSKNSAVRLSEMFAKRQVDKFYKALVKGSLSVPMTIDKPVQNKKAITQILAQKINTERQESLLDIQILTGRKHQIRQHLSDIGYPIIGDRLYALQKTEEQTIDLALTAYKIRFISPFDHTLKEYELGSEFYPDNLNN